MSCNGTIVFEGASHSKLTHPEVCVQSKKGREGIRETAGGDACVLKTALQCAYYTVSLTYLPVIVM